jgi:hypothetical protein
MNAQEARMDIRLPEVKGHDLGAVLGLVAMDLPEWVTLPKPASVSLSVRIDRLKSRLSGSGSLHATEVSVDTLRLQRVEAPIKTDGVRTTFDPMTFSMYGGTHRGTVIVSPGRWTLDSKFTGVNVGQFLAAYSGRDQHLDGTASATASLHAALRDALPRGLEGRMQVNVVNGVIREFPLLGAINRALRVAEGGARDTRFERLSATLAFAGPHARTPAEAAGPGHAATDDLVLQAREVRVEAAGRIGFNRSLDLAGLAVLSPERSAEAIRSVRELSGLRNDRGEVELPIRIGGTMDNPAFSVDLKAAAARSIKDELRRRFRNLIRR